MVGKGEVRTRDIFTKDSLREGNGWYQKDHHKRRSWGRVGTRQINPKIVKGKGRVGTSKINTKTVTQGGIQWVGGRYRAREISWHRNNNILKDLILGRAGAR